MNAMSTDPSGPTRHLPKIGTLLVGYDASESSARALNVALGLAKSVGASVWVVHASNSPRIVAEPRTEEEQSHETVAVEETLRHAEAEFRSLGVPLTVRVEEGAAAPVLLAAAHELGADMIVLGMRGLRGASRIVMGSVSAAVIAGSPRPVLIVP